MYSFLNKKNPEKLLFQDFFYLMFSFTGITQASLLLKHPQ
jgi:hypothetical protein